MSDPLPALPFVLVATSDRANAIRWKPLLADAGIRSYSSEISDAVAIALEWQFNAVILSVASEQVVASLQVLDVLAIPMIVLSEEHSELFVVTALEAGACCVMREPVSADHLKLQIARVLEKRYQPNVRSAKSITFGPVLLETNRMQAFVENVTVELTWSEFEILKVLVLNGGEIVSRDSILRALRYSILSKDARSGDMHICRLRKKLLDSVGGLVSIKTFRNQGYRLCT